MLLRRALDKGLPDQLVWRTTWDCALLEKKRGNEAAAVALAHMAVVHDAFSLAMAVAGIVAGLQLVRFFPATRKV